MSIKETTLMLTVELVFNEPFYDEAVPAVKDMEDAIKRVTNADLVKIPSAKWFYHEDA